MDAYLRTRWWSRLTPGGQGPAEELGRQLGLLVEEASKVAAELRDAEAWRQRALTRYYEDRAAPGEPGAAGLAAPAGAAEAVPLGTREAPDGAGAGSAPEERTP